MSLPSHLDLGPHRRIGVFGGTFDPPHIGHVLAAQRVSEARSLDLVLMMVANDPWQKSGDRTITPAPIRLAMTEQACFWSRRDKIRLVACDLEIREGGQTYTANTLRHLRELHPNGEFEVIVGSDAVAQLDTWHDAPWLKANADFVAVQRGGQEAQPAPGFRAEVLHLPLLELSSSEIRERVQRRAGVDHLCPPSVISLIEAHGLYRDSGSRP